MIENCIDINVYIIIDLFWESSIDYWFHIVVMTFGLNNVQCKIDVYISVMVYMCYSSNVVVMWCLKQVNDPFTKLFITLLIIKNALWSKDPWAISWDLAKSGAQAFTWILYKFNQNLYEYMGGLLDEDGPFDERIQELNTSTNI